jgi:vacuolar-type H+-ATPase subunit E/Vma4
MGLEGIIEEIRSSAAKKKQRILEEGQRQAEAIIERSRRKAQQEAEQLRRNLLERARVEAQQIVTRARLKSKLQLLALKKELVREIFEAGFEQIKTQISTPQRVIISPEGETKVDLDEKRWKEELLELLEKKISEVLWS